MKNKDWYVVKDLESFIDSTRALVFNNFGKQKNDTWDEIKLSVLPEEQEELDSVLSYSEALLITQETLKKQTHKTTSQTRYLVSDARYRKLIDAFNHRIVGNLLRSLVNKGLVESSFDNETNDFIFWVKDDTKEQPETD